MWVYLILAGELFIASLLLASMVKVWRVRRRPGNWFLLCVLGLFNAYFLFLTLEVLSPVPLKVIWFKGLVVALSLIPMCFLYLLLFYTQILRRPIPYLEVALGFIPVATSLLVLTNEYHRWIWTNLEVRTLGPLTYLHPQYTPWFGIHVGYNLTIILVGLVLLLDEIRRSRDNGRQLWPFLGGIVLVLLLAIYWYIYRPIPLMPLLFLALLVGVSLTWALRHGYLSRLIPLARTMAIENLRAGFMILDAEWQVADVNPAFARILGQPPRSLIGKNARDLLAAWPEVLRCLEGRKPCQREVTLPGGYFSVDVLPVYNEPHRTDGWILTVRDITRYRSLEQDLQRRIEYLEALFSLGKELAPLLDIAAICQRAVDSLFEVTHYSHIALYLRDPVTGDRVLKAGRDLGVTTSLARIPAGRGLSERPLRDGRLHYTPDVATEEDYLPGIGQGSEVDVPIRAHNEVVGVLVIESERTHAFEEEDLNFFMAVANQVGLAIERAMTYHRVREVELAEREQQEQLLRRVRRQQQAVVELITHPAVSEGYMEEAFRLLTEITARTLNVHLSGIWLLAQDDAEAHCADCYDALLREHRVGRDFSLAQRSEILEMLLEERVVVIDDVVHDPRTKGLEEYLWTQRQVRALLVAPIRVRGTLAGFLVAEHLHSARHWELDEVRFMSEVADIASQVILHVRLREWMERLAILNDIFLDIAALKEVDVLLQKIVERAMALLEAEAGLFMETDEEKNCLVIRVAHGLSPDVVGLEIGYDEGAAGHVLRTRAPLLIGEYRSWPQKTQCYTGDPSYHAVLTVPVLWQDRVNGVLQLLHSSSHHFTEEDVEILNLFARQAAILLHNATLLEKERRRREALEALHRASVDVASAQELPVVLERVLQFAVGLLSASNGHIFLYDGENLHFGAAWWREDSEKGSYTAPRRNGLTYTVARTGKPLIIPDVNSHPLFEDWKWGGAIASFPLKVRGRTVGVMNIAFQHPYPFPEEEVRLIELFADQAAIAIENARLLQESEERAYHLAVVRDILQLLNSSMDLHEVFPGIAQRVMELTDAVRLSVVLIEENGKHFAVFNSVSQMEVPDVPVGVTLPREMSIAAQDVLAGRVHITNDLSKELETPLERGLYEAGFRSRVNIPMHGGKYIIGSLNLAWPVLNGLDERLLPVLQQIADAMALAIERNRLLETIQHQTQELSTLYESALTLTSTLDLDVLLERLAAQIEATYYPDSIAVLRWDAERKRFTSLLVYEDGQHLRHLEGGELPLEQTGLLRWVVEHQESLLIGDVEEEKERLPVSPVRVTDFPIRSWLGIPLLVGERLVGVLTLQAERPHAFSDRDVRFLEALAPSITLALENAHLYEREHSARMQAERLFRAAQALSRTLDLNAVFSQILRELRNVVPYDSASVQELRDDTLVIIGGDGFPNLEELRGVHFALGDARHPNGEVIRRRSPVILEDAPAHYPAFREDPHAAVRIRSWLGVPMLYGDRVIGMIALDKREPGFYTEEHARIAVAFAAQAAVAIENARLFSTVQEQAQRIQRILDAMPEGVILLDADFRVSAVNPRGKDYLVALGVDAWDGPITKLGDQPIHSLLTPLPSGLHHEVQGTDQRIFEVVAEPLIQNDVVSGWVMVVRDVTHEREVQRRIEQHERLAVVGQLAAGIAHDFNNILQGIVGFAEMLARRQDLPEDVQRRLEMIARQGNRAAHLIRQILDFSRHSQPRFQALDLRDIIYELDTWLHDMLPSHIQLHMDIPDEPCIVYADLVQIQQIFMNLISNARDAMPDGGNLRISLSCVTLSPEDTPPIPNLPPGAWVALHISDTGVGIPSDALPHIFEPFFTTKDVDQGVGLGLAQVYGIVQQHNGYIDVKTSLGEGTTFSVYLPRLLSTDEGAAEEIFSSSEMQRGPRALVITRNAALLKDIGPDLKSLGYRVTSAPNTEMALHLLYIRKVAVDAVIIDAPDGPPTGMLHSLASAFSDAHYPMVIVLQAGKWQFTGDPSVALPITFIHWPHERQRMFEILAEGGKSKEI